MNHNIIPHILNVGFLFSIAHSDSSFLLCLLLRFLPLLLLVIPVLPQLPPHSLSSSTSLDTLSHSCSLSASPERRRMRHIHLSESVGFTWFPIASPSRILILDGSRPGSSIHYHVPGLCQLPQSGDAGNVFIGQEVP